MSFFGDRAGRANAADARARPAMASMAGVGVIAAILVALILNNVDRQMLALIKPLLDREFGWSAIGYGRVAAAGQLAAALCLPLMGVIVDIAPVRRCLGWGVAVWSGFTAAQALAGGPSTMLAIRVGLTGAEAIGTPAALKVLGALASPRRRAWALGLFNMAPSLGATIGPLLVPLLAWEFGWRWTAILVGGLGFVWVPWWLWVSRSGMPVRARYPIAQPAGVPLLQPAIWLLVAAKALTDQLWWVFLYWLPDFLAERGGDTVTNWAAQTTSIYLWAALGSLCGAIAVARSQHARAAIAQRWIASCCVGIAAFLLAAAVGDTALKVTACALAIFGHQIISVMIFSAISEDRFRARTGTISGIAAFAGNLTAVASLALVSRSMNSELGYAPVLAGLALAYVAGGACLICARHLNHKPIATVRSET